MSQSTDDSDEYLEFEAAIYDVLQNCDEDPSERSTFAAGGEIGPGELGIPAVSVHGVGRIGYPLSVQQSAALVSISTQAPFGKGTETVVDVAVRKAWQIRSDLVTINPVWLSNSLPKIVAECCTKLGIDAARMNVRAELYKMLLYEEGGHFKKHQDTEKEPGMFGSLLIQLPAEHEGGHLVVEHAGQSKRFEFDKDSADKAYYTSFYADCDHELQPVTKGLRLVLAFNLVRGAGSASPSCAIPTAATSAVQRKSSEEVLAAAAIAWCADPDAVQKLAYPLSYEYTPTNASFEGMKGEDCETFDLLDGATDPKTGEKLFTVHLALVSEHVTGTEEDDGYDDEYDKYGRYGRYGGYGGSGTMCADADIDTEYLTDKWVGPDGEVNMGSLSIDFETELLTAPDEDFTDACDALFGDDPDREEAEGYQGNYAGSLEYWYTAAVLVFWPAAKDFDIKLAGSPNQAIAVLQGMDRNAADFRDKLCTLLRFLRAADQTYKENQGTWRQYRAAPSWSLHAVLPLTLDLSQAREVLKLGSALVKSEEDMRAVLLVVNRYGLPALRAEFAAILAAMSLSAVVDLLTLAKQQCTFPEQPASSSEGAVLEASWSSLVSEFAAKVLQAPLTDADEALRKVCHFILAHCELEVHAKVATLLGGRLQLRTLNYLIVQLGQSVTALGDPDRAFVKVLQDRAVQRCVEQQPGNPATSTADLLAMVEWIVRGGHGELFTALKPRLTTMVASQEKFMSLLRLPAVVAELQKPSPIGAQLASLVKARIAVVETLTTPPPFTWTLPAMPQLSAHPIVPAFLASPTLQQVVLYNFGGIPNARKWASKSFGKSVHVSAVPSGIGKNACVTLTKNRAYYDARVKACAVHLQELKTLLSMLEVHAGRAASSCFSLGVARGPEEGGQGPAVKKARVVGDNVQG